MINLLIALLVILVYLFGMWALAFIASQIER